MAVTPDTPASPDTPETPDSPETPDTPARPHIISGGASGIGLATAQRLLDRGETVVVIDRAQIPNELEGRAGLTYHRQDVTDASGMRELATTMRTRWPGAASVIASAGVNVNGPFADTDFADWDSVLTTNITGTLRTVHAALPCLIASAEAGERADVITIGSIADQSYFENATVYGTCSAALKTFAAQLRIELRDEGVRVTNIAPGYVRSPFAETLDVLADEYDWLGEGLLTPDDVVDAIVFILDQPVGVAVGDVDVVATKQGWV